MMQIRQTLDYEGSRHLPLNYALKEFHTQQPFSTGFDWEFQYLWATMTDEQCLLFCLKYPQYTQRFTQI